MTYRYVRLDGTLESVAELVWACAQLDRRVLATVPATLSTDRNAAVRRLVRELEDVGGTLAPTEVRRDDGPAARQFKFSEAVEELMQWAAEHASGDERRERVLACVWVCDRGTANADSTFARSCGGCDRCNRVRRAALEYGLYDLEL